MNQLQTPLFDTLERFYQQNTVSYHVPGHKSGQVFLEKGKDLYRSLLQIDVTELTGLDDLHAPVGPIREAEILLAELYGVKYSYFLVNGTTVGILAMILATCNERDRVLVQRNCHKSVLHALMLANVEPIFLAPTVLEDWSVAGGVDGKLVSEALEKYPDTKAIILTYPNYYGHAQDLSDIVALAHEKGIPVLVDEAHGAHFTLGHPFPESSITKGADIVVHSAHKTLPAMTMGSFLHINSSIVDVERVEFYLQMLQSSSPSYPIIASLDLARAYLASYSKQDLKFLIDEINRFKEALSAIPEIKVLNKVPKSVKQDPLKLNIQSTCGLSGYKLQSLLEKKGIFTELADTRNILFVLPLLKNSEKYPFGETADKIRTAVRGQSGPYVDFSNFQWMELEKISTLAFSYAKMKQATKEQVHFDEAIGKIAGEMIIPYPPGIPLIVAGEQISAKKMIILQQLLDQHARFHGGTGLAQRKVDIFNEDIFSDF